MRRGNYYRTRDDAFEAGANGKHFWLAQWPGVPLLARPYPSHEPHLTGRIKSGRLLAYVTLNDF
jgi:hypothetical protein